MNTQKDWIEQQKREHAQAKFQEDEEERAYAQQTDVLNRMRGMLEDENTQKRNNMMKQMQEENRRLAQQKKANEDARK